MSSAPTGGSTRRQRVRSHASTQPTVPLHRWAHVVIVISIVLINLIQHPGYTTFDTKLDLTENPGGFIRDALQVWNPSVDMGSLQNQAYGYLFPVAPFFWVGDAIGAPMWIWQRLWSALLMLIAYEGMRRLARATGGLGPGAAVVAALAFAFAPRVLGTVGVLSGETLPGAILPWTVLPLAHAWHRRQSWGRAVVLSAATLPFMSGLNATEVLCTLPLPGLVILCAPLPIRERLRWGATWSALVVIACLWWLVPLLVMGRYAPPFLDYIESATSTTAPLGWLTVLRGTTHWATFLPADESHWITGHELTYQPLLVAVATVVGVTGLLGLTLRRVPMRRPLLLAAGLVFVLMALGHGGLGGSVLSDGMRSFLDGGGAPFRNIHKFDPVARVGTSIGLAWAVTALNARLRTWAAAQPPSAWRAGLTRLPAAGAAGLVLVLALPLAQGNLRSDDGWREIPQPWQQMQRTLQALPEGSRVMVLPGPGFVDQTWGRTVDELVQTMPGVQWASRTQIPLVSPGGLRLLESIEERISTGRPSDGLAPMLAQAGFTHVLVRNDLNPGTTDVPSTARLHTTLQSSRGFRPGPTYGVGDGGYPMLELYSLTGLVPRARAVEASGVRELAGESDQLIPLSEASVLRPDEVTVTRGSRLPVRARILTEGVEKRERSFGRVHDGISGVRTRDDPWNQRRAAHDYGAIDTTTPTVVDYGPIARFTASSSSDNTTNFGRVRRDQAPWAAFDRSLLTQFVTAPLTPPKDQWVEAALKKRSPLGTITIVMGGEGAPVTSLKVTTDAGSRQVRVPDTRVVTIRDLGGPTTKVRIHVAGVGPDAKSSQVAISSVHFSRLTPTRTEIVAEPADATTTMSFRTWPGRAECVTGRRGVECEPGSAMAAEEAGGLARRVTMREGGQFAVSGLVRVTGGAPVDALLLPLADGVAVRASSVHASEPLNSPSRALDGAPTTGWTSAAGDAGPWLDLAWTSRRTIRNFSLSTPPSIPGQAPRVVSALANGKPVQIRRAGDGWVLAKPVAATSLRILFAGLGEGQRAGVGEVRVGGLEDLTYRVGPALPTGQPCGLGPVVTVGGRQVQTRVTGVIGDVTTGKAMRVESCSGDVELRAGNQRLSMAPVPGFVPLALTLTPQGTSVPRTRDLPLAISSWEDESRSLRIGGTTQAVLALPENINDGWVAQLNGVPLRPVTVDGWKQGFVVPAGSNRVIELTYQPGNTYRTSLAVGAFAALVLLMLAAWLLVRGGARGRQRATSSAAPPRGAHVAAPAPHGPRPRASALALAGGVGGLALFGGVPPAIGLLAGALVPARWTTSARVLAVLVAGVAALTWALRVESASARTGVDLVLGLIFGLAIGLALGPLRRFSFRRAPHA